VTGQVIESEHSRRAISASPRWIWAGRSSRVAPVVSPKAKAETNPMAEAPFPAALTEAVKALWRIPRPGPDLRRGLVKVALAEPALWSREAYLNDLLTRGRG
jgi:hypothetical protein